MACIVVFSSVKKGEESLCLLPNEYEKEVGYMYSFLNTNISDFLCRNVDNELKKFSSNLNGKPISILFLSENFCPDCVNKIMTTYNNIPEEKPRLFIVFNDITIRELSFRQEIFKDVICLSSQGTTEYMLAPQTLMYVDKNNLILNMMFLSNTQDVDLSDLFFKHTQNHFTHEK